MAPRKIAAKITTSNETEPTEVLTRAEKWARTWSSAKATSAPVEPSAKADKTRAMTNDVEKEKPVAKAAPAARMPRATRSVAAVAPVPGQRKRKTAAVATKPKVSRAKRGAHAVAKARSKQTRPARPNAG